MRRREFVITLGSVAATVAWPLAAHTQPAGKVPKVGMLYPGPQAAAPPRVEALLKGLRTVGYAAPAQVELVLRVANGDPARIAPLAAEIIANNVDVTFAVGPAVVRAFRSATQTVPIVANDLESDPVDIGIAKSLAHPGGNVTGVFLAFPEFSAKWLELLKQTIPQLSRVAVLWDPTTGSMQKSAIAGAAEELKVTLEILEARTPSDFDEAFISASRGGAGAMLMLSSPLVSANVRKLAELAILHRLPTVTLFPDFARAGGLMAYGPNLLGAIQQAGGMVGKVLQGISPADLPIERPSQFQLVINLKTAKALGLDVPPTVLARADELIE
jgi:putative ABC transport system substrate-binding protein